MSIFASRTQRVVALPFDEPHTVTVQKLAGRHLERAKQADQEASVASLQRLGGPAFQRELGGLGDPAAVAALVATRQADPLHGYDRYVVLEKGIVAWTYLDVDGKPLPVTADTIDDLDDQAADFLARAILDLTPRRDAAARKNG